MSPLAVLLFTLASIEALTGFVFAEAVRIYFFSRWSKRKTREFLYAWCVGGTLYLINILNVVREQATGVALDTPTSGMDVGTAVLVYPLMCLAVWPMLLAARDAVLPHRRGP